MDRHSGADTSSADCSSIFALRGCFLYRSAPDQLSALSRGQNPAAQHRACSLERTSECAVRSACCSSLPDRKPVSSSPAVECFPAAAEPPSTSDGYKAAGPTEIEPDLQSPRGGCRL